MWIETTLKDGKNSKCAICCEAFELNDRHRKLKCGHNYHTACIDEWFKE